MIQSARRRILSTLRRTGPLSAKELAAELDLHEGTAANLCSMMSRDGELSEDTTGGRRGRKYIAAVDMLDSDVEILAGLVETYGLRNIVVTASAAAKVIRSEASA